MAEGQAVPPASPFARPGPREQQRAATRERLYDAALDEFRRVGFERASVAEIARMAGVSRPSFYAHFPTKDHVLFELQWRLSQARQRGELKAGMDPARAARLCLTGVFGHLLGIQCTPDERRNELKALFSLYKADAL